MSPLETPVPRTRKEREKNQKVLYNLSSELATQNPTGSYSNRPTLNKRQQELQQDLHKKQWTWTKRLRNANPVETAEKLDGQDFWTEKARLILSKNLKIKTKTALTNLTCFDRRKGQQQNQAGSQKKTLTRLLLSVFLFNQCLLEEPSRET